MPRASNRYSPFDAWPGSSSRLNSSATRRATFAHARATRCPACPHLLEPTRCLIALLRKGTRYKIQDDQSTCNAAHQDLHFIHKSPQVRACSRPSNGRRTRHVTSGSSYSPSMACQASWVRHNLISGVEQAQLPHARGNVIARRARPSRGGQVEDQCFLSLHQLHTLR